MMKTLILNIRVDVSIREKFVLYGIASLVSLSFQLKLLVVKQTNYASNLLFNQNNK